MDQHIAEIAPTSSATTRETEPEVRAAILSGEGGPGLPTSLRSGGFGFAGIGQPLLLLAAALVLGYGTASWLRGRR